MPSKNGSDSLSLHTLGDYTPDSSTDDAPPRYRDAVPDSQRHRANSPSRSSFFSSSAGSVSEFTPDTASEFSERHGLLSQGATTPPPQYRSPRQSLSTVRESLDQEVGEILLDDPLAPDTVCDDPRKGGCGGRRRRCCKRHRRRDCYKDSEKPRVIISVIFVCVLVGFILGFVVTRTSARRRGNGWPVSTPSWAKGDCSSRDGRYNHYEFNDIRDLEVFDGPHGAFSGTIRVLPPMSGQTADLVLKQMAKKTKSLDVRVNGHPGVRSEKREPSFSSLSEFSSSLLEKRGRGRCDAEVVMHFRDGLTINSLQINTHSGRIQVFSNLKISGTTSVTTKAGRISADSFFNTRKTYINAGSSSLEGHFKLYDLLSITSTAGRIQVTIDPQEADEHNPKPAELIVESQSGSIQLSNSYSPPKREYITTVTSRDGRIEGTILHGTKTLVKSTSGMIDVDVLPYDDKPSNLHISSASGRQQVTVHNPVSGNKLAHMESQHTSQSGALSLKYPSSWAGKIDGSTTSGSLEVRGYGVHVIDQGQHYVRAEKDSDEGKSELVFRGQSGSASLSF